MDESSQTNMTPVFKWLLISISYISILLGLIGVFLPILPTTPFFILSAFIFSKTSPRLHLWLTSLPYFGDAIIDWEKNRVIKRKAKYWAISLIFLSMSYVIIFKNVMWPLKILLGLIGLSLILFIGSRKSRAGAENEKIITDLPLS